jgi:hypothetical protein
MDEKFLYFEPQTAALCGVHAINTLLGKSSYLLITTRMKDARAE